LSTKKGFKIMNPFFYKVKLENFANYNPRKTIEKTPNVIMNLKILCKNK